MNLISRLPNQDRRGRSRTGVQTVFKARIREDSARMLAQDDSSEERVERRVAKVREREVSRECYREGIGSSRWERCKRCKNKNGSPRLLAQRRGQRDKVRHCEKLK
jgi:hypothetical protein